MNGIILTRDTLFRLAGFNPVKDLKRARKATLKALGAQMGDGRPDHATQLKATDQLYKLHDAYPRPSSDGEELGRPVNVTIVLAGSQQSGAALQTHGVRLHLNGDNGAGS